MSSDNKCVECGSKRLMEQSGEIICRDCGLVLDDMPLEQGVFLSESSKRQATHPYLAQAGSKPFEGKIYKAVWMLSGREKNLQGGMAKIDLIGSKLNLSEVIVKESKLIFKKALYSNTAVGRDSLSLTYASVYLACSLHKIPKTLLELTAYSEIDNRQLMRAVRIIKRNLNIETQPTNPLDLLPRFASKLDLKSDTITLATELLMKIKNTKITAGKRPETILAGVIYLAGKQNNDERTQRQIANAIGIIEITIRKISKEITCLK